ncbi:MAG: diacylglycerol kinase family lipid kinase [Arcicella sp.]|nr:diacylglycerol kinase family lipid kinase [Arcicella sp.]
MTQSENLKLFFIINLGSGNNTTDWSKEIKNYFVNYNHDIELYYLTQHCNIETIKEKIKLFLPDIAVAVGGDGTIKLVAECILKTKIKLGILPAGSANGLAKELGISNVPVQALNLLVAGHSQKIHTVQINGQLCIHLSDVGLNAYVVKEFENQPVRGMWGYFMASLKVLWQNPLMVVQMKIGQTKIKIKAKMIVIANATKYGTGAIINPIGKLDDELFEVIVIKKISILEMFKMIVSHEPYDSEKTEIFQTNELFIKSYRKVHFQIDGEYLGKVKEIKATIMPDCLEVIVPN